MTIPNQPAPTGQAVSGRAPRALLDIQLETRFALDAGGRIVSEGPPDGSPGPLMILAGCYGGPAARYGRDVTDDEARELDAVVADEPELAHRDDMPLGLERCLAILGRRGPVEVKRELSFHLPNGGMVDSELETIAWGTPRADDLVQRLAVDGMPAELIEMGFRDVSDLWAPWRLAVVDGRIACLAFAARLSPQGAELGLATVPGFRGRGLAALTTTAWSALPALDGRTLFYSTSRSNLASQRVAAKLGLALIGPAWEIVRS